MSAKSPKTIHEEPSIILFDLWSRGRIRGKGAVSANEAWDEIEMTLKCLKTGLLAGMPKYMAEERYDEALADCIQAIESYFGGKDD